ncbi:2'-5' RNA ligase family protein, partial [Jatrophihabitans endophyticus]|uniref:2'-5' RNA ligase family protein n=1 Tax=Jatrophihabitans endophyticus TaxID=1206085 RepID=UPI0019F1EE84
ELDRRHGEWQRRWWPHLTRQDQQPLRAHVTVQNKVEPSEARRTVETLRASFVPFATTASGFRLWRYDGGPWTLLAEFAFSDD